MDLKTRYNLWKLKRAVGPSTAFKAVLRKDLNIIWNTKYGNSASFFHVATARVAASFAVVTMLLTGGGWVFAYTSPEVTEGSVLYPVKEAIETVEEAIKITPEAKAKFYIKKIERREAERGVLEKKIKLPEIKEIQKEEIKQEREEIKKDKEETRGIIKEVKKEVRLEAKEKIKIEIAERKIKRTETSIENIEEQLEKTRQIMEKNESKNIKLREELKNRAEKRLEKIKSNQEKLRELRLRNNVKIEARNTSSINR